MTNLDFLTSEPPKFTDFSPDELAIVSKFLSCDEVGRMFPRANCMTNPHLSALDHLVMYRRIALTASTAVSVEAS